MLLNTTLLLIGLCDLRDGYLLIDYSEPWTGSSLQPEDLREAMEQMGITERQRKGLFEFQAATTLIVGENKARHNSWGRGVSIRTKASCPLGRPARAHGGTGISLGSWTSWEPSGPHS